MRIVINEVSYSLAESVGGAGLGDLMALKLQSKGADFAGVTVPSIQAMFKRLGELPDEFKSVDLLADEDFLRNIIGVMFLARRKAGETLTYEAAGDVAFNDLQLLDDEDDEAADAPKGEAGNEPPALT